MTATAIVTKSDLKRMADFVRENPGLCVEIERDGTKVRVFPDIQAMGKAKPVDQPEDFETVEAWRSWRDAEDAREAGRRP